MPTSAGTDRWRFLLALLAAMAAAGRAPAQINGEERRPLVPDVVSLNEAAREAIDAPYLIGAERRRLRIFHGVWD